MATVTGVGHATNTTSGTKTLLATSNPAVGDLLLVWTMHTGNTTELAPTDDHGGTYVLVVVATKAGAVDKSHLWLRTTLISSATALTFTHAPGATSGGALQGYRVAGMARLGLNAVKRSGATNDAAAGTTAQVSWSGGGLSDVANPVFAFCFNGTTFTSQPAAPTDLPQTGGGSYTTPSAGWAVCRVDSGVALSTITWAATCPTAYGVLAVELDTSAATISLAAAIAGSGGL